MPRRHRFWPLMKSTLVHSLSRAPLRFRGMAEEVAAESQGKGWGGGTVAREAKALAQLLGRRASVAPIVFDIGANFGAWSEQFLKASPLSTVVCFEPGSYAFASLTEKFDRDQRVHAHNVGVSSIQGKAELWMDRPGSGLASRYRRDLSHLGIEFCDVEVVDFVELDQWCEDTGVWPDGLKLDIEGHEFEVMRSAPMALRAASAIQFEFGGANIDSRTYWRDFFELLSDSNFEVWRLTPSGLQRIARYRERDEYFRTSNYFAAKQPEP